MGEGSRECGALRYLPRTQVREHGVTNESYRSDTPFPPAAVNHVE
jgi:hypothetical protein